MVDVGHQNLDIIDGAVKYLSSDADGFFGNNLTGQIQKTYPIESIEKLRRGYEMADNVSSILQNLAQALTGNTPVNTSAASAIGAVNFIAKWAIKSLVASWTSCSNAVVSEKVCLLAIYVIALNRAIHSTATWLRYKSDYLRSSEFSSPEIKDAAQREAELAENCSKTLLKLEEQLKVVFDLKTNHLGSLFHILPSGDVKLNRNVAPTTVVVLIGNDCVDLNSLRLSVTEYIPSLLEDLVVFFDVELFNKREQKNLEEKTLCSRAYTRFKSMIGFSKEEETVCPVARARTNDHAEDIYYRINFITEAFEKLESVTTSYKFIHIQIFHRIEMAEIVQKEKKEQRSRLEKVEEAFENGTFEMCFNENDTDYEHIWLKQQHIQQNRDNLEKFCDKCIFTPSHTLKTTEDEAEKKRARSMIHANEDYCKKIAKEVVNKEKDEKYYEKIELPGGRRTKQKRIVKRKKQSRRKAKKTFKNF